MHSCVFEACTSEYPCLVPTSEYLTISKHACQLVAARAPISWMQMTMDHIMHWGHSIWCTSTVRAVTHADKERKQPSEFRNICQRASLQTFTVYMYYTHASIMTILLPACLPRFIQSLSQTHTITTHALASVAQEEHLSMHLQNHVLVVYFRSLRIARTPL